MERYVVGVDFGSDSVRAVVINAADGTMLAQTEHGYPRWLAGKYQDMEKRLFRQHPLDYIEAFTGAMHGLLDAVSGEVRAKIMAISFAATGSTPCPVDRMGTPLALLPEFAENPNAMFHLWKDHTAIQEAAQINAAFSEDNGVDYTKYQGAYCSEWYWAKILHTIRMDEKVKAAAYSWVEHCDWMPALLTGNTEPHTMYRCACAAGHKALWHSEWNGLPSPECLQSLDPYLTHIRDTYAKPQPSDHCVGKISREWAQRLGVGEHVLVGGSSLDAHAGAVGAGVAPNVMVINIGTSAVNMMVERADKLAGKQLCAIGGQAEDSIIPGFVGFETSQASFGDLFAWLKRFLLWPMQAFRDMEREQHAEFTSRIEAQLLGRLQQEAALLPIEGALTALDWFNGRRYPNTNEEVMGALSRLTLGTTAPAVYQSLAMAAAFGQKKIIDALIREGVEIHEIIAVGGIAQKSPYIMQVLSDVLGVPIKVSSSLQACARGAAIYAAVSMGEYTRIEEAQRHICEGYLNTYLPEKTKAAAYAAAYGRYLRLGEYAEAATQ